MSDNFPVIFKHTTFEESCEVGIKYKWNIKRDIDQNMMGNTVWSQYAKDYYFQGINSDLLTRSYIYQSITTTISNNQDFVKQFSI